jgi:hypothetical protein
MLEIRAHEIVDMQWRLKGYNRDLTETHGETVAKRVEKNVEAIKCNPDIPIKITDSFGSNCSENCKQRLMTWHHCEGTEIKEYEAREAHKQGLKIGEVLPAKRIFDIF